MSMTVHKRISAKLTRLGKLAEELRADIVRCYPPGTRVGVMLRSTQKIPTPATVCGSRVDISTWSACAFGYVRVEIDTSKPSSRQRFRDIALSDVRRL